MRNLSEEEIIKYLYTMEKEYRRFGDLDNPDYEDSDKIHQAIQGLLDLYNKEKEKNKKLKEKLINANECIENEIYVDENPTICGYEEDTITELPMSLILYNEDLRKLLDILEFRDIEL